MRRSLLLLAACSLAGCGSQPVEPDPVAPVVLRDVAPPLECPEPELPHAPAELDQPLELPAPQVLPAGQGDYGIARGQVERMIDALRMAHERNERWRAWAP